VVTVYIDASESGQPQTSCANKWPYAVVTDSKGNPVPSQWSAVIGDVKAGEQAYAFVTSVSSSSAPLSPDTASGTLRTVNLGGGTLASMRYELSFAVDVPALSLATFFITSAWNVLLESKPGGPADPSVVLEGLLASPGCVPEDASSTAHLSVGAAAATTMLSVVPSSPPPTVQMPDGSTLRPGLLDRVTALDAPGISDVPILLENACLAVEVDRRTGLLLGVTYKHAASTSSSAESPSVPVRVRVRQRFGAYATSQSGAYIFRPVQEPEWWNQAVPSATVQVSSVPLVDAAGADGAPAALLLGGLMQQAKVAGSIFSQVSALGHEWAMSSL
jgi:hypothetical protein